MGLQADARAQGTQTTVTINVNIPGDANSDGIVDSQDFTVLKANFGGAGGWAQGDYNGDGLTDSQDFTILKANFGSTGAQPAEAGAVHGGLEIMNDAGTDSTLIANVAAAVHLDVK